MPHNFMRINAVTPNPGRRRREDVESICKRHHGQLENLWFDDQADPSYAYVLVKDGDVDGMLQDLHGQELLRLFEAPK